MKGIIESGTTVGVIETVWEVTTAQSGTVYRRMVKQALKGGYTSYFRYASPHRLGGGEVRPRLFIFLVPTAAVERVGPPPLLALSRGGVPTRTVRSCLTNTDSRETVVVGPIRWRRGPRRVGAAVILGHYGRGGKGDADLLDSIWSVDGAAPPTEDLSKVVYACDGQLIRLTPREFARVRGIHDSIDIGEGAGPRHARSCVRRSPSVSAVAAATAAAKDYIHSVRGAARADREDPPQCPEAARPTETKAAPQLRDAATQGPSSRTSRPSRAYGWTLLTGWSGSGIWEGVTTEECRRRACTDGGAGSRARRSAPRSAARREGARGRRAVVFINDDTRRHVTERRCETTHAARKDAGGHSTPWRLRDPRGWAAEGHRA